MPTYTVLVTQYIAAGTYFTIVFQTTTATITLIVWCLVKVFFHPDQYAQVVALYLPGIWPAILFYISLVISLLPGRSLGEATYPIFSRNRLQRFPIDKAAVGG
jgi:hypothetical protein